MKTDRELLELAAKAAGYKTEKYEKERGVLAQIYADFLWSFLSPLTDDGDALRLAVKLGITIGPESPDVIGKSLCRASWNGLSMSLGEYGDGDKYAATRRAIVRAAAAIGEGME